MYILKNEELLYKKLKVLNMQHNIQYSSKTTFHVRLYCNPEPHAE